jgi:hypothetical protein
MRLPQMVRRQRSHVGLHLIAFEICLRDAAPYPSRLQLEQPSSATRERQGIL